MANLRPIKPGEVRNPTGENGWTKARELVREIIAERAEDIVGALFHHARFGSETALKLLAGPLLPAVQQKIEHEHGGEVTLRWEGEEKSNGHSNPNDA